MNNTERIAEIENRYDAIATAGLLDGEPYDDVKEYVEVLAADRDKWQRLAEQRYEYIRSLGSDTEQGWSEVQYLNHLLEQSTDHIESLTAELEQKTRELARLAIESVEREKHLAKLEAEVQRWADAEKDGNLFIISEFPQNMSDILEPLKLASALQSECRKIEFRKENRPKDVNILDYTIIAALKKCLESALSAEGVLE